MVCLRKKTGSRHILYASIKKEEKMSTYDLARLAVFGLMFILGLVMTVIPKQCTKKEFRDDPSQVAKIRKNGIGIMICGVLLIVVNILV